MRRSGARGCSSRRLRRTRELGHVAAPTPVLGMLVSAVVSLRAVWPRRRWGLWSNAGVFVRVWEYQVLDDRAAAFTAAYAPDGAWGQLFARAAGFFGTELYHDAARGDRYLTIDRWRDEQDWRSFLRAFGSAYESLDAQLEGLAVAERSLFEGSS